MMPYFLAGDGSVHFLDADDVPTFGKLLPPDSVQITDEEAEAIRNPPDKVRDAINEKRDLMLVRIRGEREIMMNRLNGIYNTEVADNAGAVTAYATEIIGFIKQLRGITDHPLVLPKRMYPYTDTDLLAATNNAYLSIISTASARLKTDFKKARGT